VQEGPVETILAGGTDNTSVNCPANYTVTGGSCLGSLFGLDLVTAAKNGGLQGWFCAWQNPTAGPINIQAEAICHRIPGR
ncbi:MAG: hypothetical protein ACRD2A_13505, partial [Vicinamibacterales bacterium]